MASMEEFLRAPKEEVLDHCPQQLVRIAEHFKLDEGDGRLKEYVRSIIKESV